MGVTTLTSLSEKNFAYCVFAAQVAEFAPEAVRGGVIPQHNLDARLCAQVVRERCAPRLAPC